MPRAAVRCSLIALSIAMLVPTDAHAAMVARNETYPAVGVCQAALPAFEGAIRKRPRAVQNEGSTTAFVSCGLPGRGGNRSIGANARYLIVYLTNVGSESATVSCTGLEGFNTAAGVTTSRIVPVGSDQPIEFTATQIDPVSSYWRIPAVSCALPPGVGITVLWYGFVEDNGV